MKVILLKDDKKLGKKNQIIDIADGYARNQLIPKDIAIEATNENINNIKLKNKNLEKIEFENIVNAEKDKDIIESKTIVMHIKVGDTGRTFGSITSKEISDAIYSEFKLEVDKKKIELDDSIKNVGLYNINIRLHKQVRAILKLNVESE